MIGAKLPRSRSAWINAMPFVPCENCALVEFRATFDGQKVENTVYVLNEAAWDGSSLTELVTEAQNWWGVNYSGLASNVVHLAEVVATDLTTESSSQASIDGGGFTGTVSGLALPGNCSVSVSFRTSSRGRSFRGRNYIIGIPESKLEGTSIITTDYADLITTAYEAFLDTIGTAGWTWVALSRFSGVDPTTHKPIPRSAGVMTPITNVLLVDRTIDSQRRRLPGRGN